MSDETLLAIEDLCVSFRTEAGLLRAVDKVSFRVRPREIVGLVGESGSGKSQSLMAIMGLITSPNAVVSGSIKFMGQELVGLPRKALDAIRGSQMAMIFQDPMTALTPVYTIGWQIMEQVRAHERVTKSAARARAVELLRAVGIPSPELAADRFPHQLSGGMRQRVVIAMALSCNPKLLIADEPTTALDATVQAQILELIGRLRDEFGSAVILVTHDLGVVGQVADRVMVMYAGRIVEAGGRADLFSDPLHPYAWGLFASIPPMEGSKPRRLTTISGSPPSLLSLPPGCPFQPRCRYVQAACTVRPDLVGVADHLSACTIPLADRPGLRAQQGVLA